MTVRMGKLTIKPLPSQDELLRRLDYDPETGILRWKFRPASDWHVTKVRDAEACARWWNSAMAGKEAMGNVNTSGYKSGLFNKKTYATHRIIWKLVHGREPMFVDHINGVRTDNRIVNLRDVSGQSENCRNKRRRYDNKSGVTGVRWDSSIGSWVAYLQSGRRQIVNKRCDSFEEAVAVRKAAEREHGFHKNHDRAE